MWLKWQRRGDFYRDFYAYADEHGFDDEVKWTSASRGYFLPFYKDLIDYFFRRQWMVFHCLVVRKQAVRREEYHKNDWDLARRKHHTMLLTAKMRKAIKRYPDKAHEFRVYVDAMPSRYAKSDEAMEVITNNVLNQRFRNLSPVTSVMTRNSADTPAIQLCDLLLGAVMETWQKKATNSTKLGIRSIIANYPGWEGLDADTMPGERKFNIWYFHDPVREKRKVKTRKVSLVYPYPG